MTDLNKTATPTISCRLVHHGAAATSSSKAVVCIPASKENDDSSLSSEIVYASHAMLNVTHRVTAKVAEKQEPVWRVHQTLRTRSHGSANANTTVSTYTAKRVISCVAVIRNDTMVSVPTTLACGFSDGTISIWTRKKDQMWNENILVHADDTEHWDGRAITDIAGIHEDGRKKTINVVTCSSGGAYQLRASMPDSDENTYICLKRTSLIPTPANTVRFHQLSSNTDATLLLIGTAAPRHNKIHVFVLYGQEKNQELFTNYCGTLSGHEDWITCFDWHSLGNVDHLASGSQDARIRLWKFTTSKTTLVESENIPELEADTVPGDSDEEEVDDDDEQEIEEGESRLEVLIPGKTKTSVTLEALLIGHEERVTSVAWHPNPKPMYGEDLILISSSMDRSIFIWSEVSGIWTPISRVGSAGGILGGSIGSSLLGFLNIQLEPENGKWMMGHAYGGALQFFSCEQDEDALRELQTSEMSAEERAAFSPWKAQPCVTGHFDNVTDLCWESYNGDYLITAGNDQTCRVWMSLPLVDSRNGGKEVWVEIARPQVHGYDLSAVTSVSTSDHLHLLASGADEKELRVFDATGTFEQLLRRLSPRSPATYADIDRRVDLAYIPSLGLSNKASASEGAEQDTGGVSESNTQLPLERDLGAVSLWPEMHKLYGHNTELMRLSSTTTALSGIDATHQSQKDVIVASSAKARDAEAACIHLWNVRENRCAQVLKGGHRSTVTAISFSPNARFLVSSGKDRRLCIWQRQQTGDSLSWGHFKLACAVDTAHKRIVWGAHFCPFDSTVFASCSRDGTVKVWKLSETAVGDSMKASVAETLSFSPATLGPNGKPEAVTSLSFAPKPTPAGGTAALLAIGIDNGMIELWQVGSIEGTDQQASLVLVLSPNLCHIDTVTKLAWRPVRLSIGRNDVDGNQEMVLASCSMDHGCRLYRIKIY